MRLLAAHWPALIAWFLAGQLAGYLALRLAGSVGAYSAVGGFLILPLGALAQLISIVAMLLVLRDGMRELRAIAPRPSDAVSRRRSFVDALMGGILPFFAFYFAWGYLREDFAVYLRVALDAQQVLALNAALAGEEFTRTGTVDDIGFDRITVTLIVVAFALRWAWKRWRVSLPKVLSIVAVYVETLWIFLTLYLINDLIGVFTVWVDHRQAMVWLSDAREWVNGYLVPVAWLWDGVEWFIGEAGGIILLPVAWITIAGVIYGQAVAAEAPRLSGAERLQSHISRVPSWVRRRMIDFGLQLASLFRPIWSALVLMWRAGPVVIGSFVLLFTIVLALERASTAGIVRLIGPHDRVSFWEIVFPLVGLGIAMVMEPLRISLIAAAYDGTIGRLRARSARVEPNEEHTSGRDGKLNGPGDLADLHVEIERERTVNSFRDDEGKGDVVRRPSL